MEFMFVIAFFVFSVIFQGLYFVGQSVIASIVMILYTAYIIYQRRCDLERSHAFFSLLGFTLIYVASVFYGVNQAGAVDEALKAAGFLPAFLIGLWCTEVQKEWMCKGIVISGVIASLIGFAALSGIVHIPGALYGERMQSTFHYANVMALYLMIGILFVLQFTAVDSVRRTAGSIRLKALGSKEPIGKVRQVWRILKKWWGSIAVYLLICGLILTYSRGVWLLFIFVNMFVLFSNKLLARKYDRLRYLYTLLIAVITSMLLASGVQGFLFWLVLLLGVLLCILPCHVGNYLQKINFLASNRQPSIVNDEWPTDQHSFFDRCSRTKNAQLIKWSLMFLTLIPFSFCTIRLLNVRGGPLVPTEWVVRMAYYKGAVRLIFDYPLFGAGAAGWQVLCEQYIGYYVKYVHNYFLQVLCDVGLVGFAFLAIFLACTVHCFLKKGQKDWCAYLVIMSILLHSLVDVAMHFQLISAILFLFCGIIMNKKDANKH